MTQLNESDITGRPQLARQHYASDRQLSTSTSGYKSTALKRPASKGRGGRKIGKAEEMRRRERERQALVGEVREYTLTLVRREGKLDSYRTSAMASDEAALWAELSRLHLAQLRRTDLTGVAHKMAMHEANEAYSLKLFLRMQEVQSGAMGCLLNISLSEGARMLQFHAYRRVLSILHQEDELLRMDDAQARAVGNDGAFIAAGRCIKQRSFAAHFGWWSPRDLLDTHGLLTDEDERFERPDVVLAEAVADALEADQQIAALFDPDVQDDSSGAESP